MKQQQLATNFLHLHQESQSLSAWTRTQRRFSRQSTINNLATPSTTPTATYTMSSTLVAIRKQSLSTKGKIMRKSKPTVRHPTIGYPISAGTTRRKGAVTKQHLLPNQSRQILIALTRRFTQDASCTPKSSFQCITLRHSEHLQLLPTKTTKKRANTSNIMSNK